jgi:hypothetical protein
MERQGNAVKVEMINRIERRDMKAKYEIRLVGRHSAVGFLTKDVPENLFATGTKVFKKGGVLRAKCEHVFHMPLWHGEELQSCVNRSVAKNSALVVL